MARKPVKIVTDLQVKKRIKKVDSSDNVLFDVSGTLQNGHVSSSLPLTASNIYTPGNLEVGGTITANQYHVTYQTSSVLLTSGSTRFGNSNDDTHQFTGSVYVNQNVTANTFYGTASFATTALTASYVGTSSAINNFTNDVRAQFTAGDNISIVNGVITASAGSGGGLSTVYTTGSITGSGLLDNPISLKTNITVSSVTASFSGSGINITDITASNILNFTNDVRNQFNPGTDIGIVSGVISYIGTNSGLTSVETSGSITGSGIISNPVTLKDPLIISTLSASYISGSYISGNFIGNGSLLTNLTASSINNFISDVRSQFAAGTDIDITSGIISYTGAGGGGLTSVETSGSITGSGIIANPITLKDPLVIGTITASLAFNGNLYGTASYATNSATASYVENAQSASYVLNAVSSSFATNSLTASNSLVGAAEDGDFTDGLFTDITTTTPVGTVVDRFNEILKALAPAPAPDLSNLERTSGGVGANSLFLAFGTGSKEVTGYTAVTASLTGLANVGFAQQYSVTTGAGGGRIRQGVFVTPSVITMSLNNSVAADAGTFTNYSAKAFDVSSDGVGTYKLEINDVEISPNGSTSTTASVNTQTFALTAANTASFTTSGQGLNLFRHRTGTVGIPTSSWRNGHNYAKVTHVSSLGTHVTNYVDWVYDPTGSSGVEAYTFTTPTSASFSATGQKSLSGVKYYTGATYNFSSSVGNYYKNVYAAGGLTFDSVTSGMSAASITIPTPNLNTDNIQVSSLHTLNGAVRILNSTLTSRLNATNNLGKTGNTTLTTNTILYDNINTTNTTLIEYFTLETYRASSGSYDTQSSASSAIGTFPSGSSLASGELAVYNGAVRYPTQILNGGNVSGSGVVHMLSNQPNYSGVTDNRGYFRVFQNGGSSVASFTIAITGSSGISVVPYNSSLSANAVRIWVKVPGKTGWRDISTAAPGSTSGIALNDNVGCLQGSATTTSTTSQHTVNLLTEALGVNEYFLIKIEASSVFTNNISRITISGL